MQLVVSWHMKAATMCEFSKQEFIGGLQALGYACIYLMFTILLLIIMLLMSTFSNGRIDTLEKFRERIPFMRSELKDERMLKSECS